MLKLCAPIRQVTLNTIKLNRISRLSLTNALKKQYATKKPADIEEDVIDDGPIKYSTSRASSWRAEYSRTGSSGSAPRLWYEPTVILGSLTVFMVYFTMLREENDIDEELSRTLYSRIDGLEEHQLRMSLKYNIEKGLETDALVKRIKEIEDEKQKARVAAAMG